ncbi:MAG TPA: hypothetical protein VD905_13505 [Flavobacteriales bacterium]|nr:hypothetical protein [Flavobacteriales bacterium]
MKTRHQLFFIAFFCLQSCNMARHYANMRISHEQIEPTTFICAEQHHNKTEPILVVHDTAFYSPKMAIEQVNADPKPDEKKLPVLSKRQTKRIIPLKDQTLKKSKPLKKKKRSHFQKQIIPNLKTRMT